MAATKSRRRKKKKPPPGQMPFSFMVQKKTMVPARLKVKPISKMHKKGVCECVKNCAGCREGTHHCGGEGCNVNI